MWPQHDEKEQWDHASPRRWMVEYIVEISGEKHHHLTVLKAQEPGDVHKALLRELQRTYMTTERVEVMVLKMEPVATDTDALLFEGIFTP